MSLLHPGLEAFAAVIEHGTVHGAARAIGLTQTGVTQRIRTLERQLGTTLFTRSRRGMRPTVEGDELLRYCQRVNDLEGELWSFLERDQAARDVRLQIAGPSSIMRCRIIPSAARVLDRFPGVVFTFNLNDDAPLLGLLKSGACQLAALERHEVVDELDSKLLRPAEYVLVASAGWRGRRLREIVASERIVDFNPSDDATFRYLELFGLRDLARRERHLANNTDALAALVADGRGYSVLSRDFAAPLVERGELIALNRGRSMKIEFALAWYPRHEMPAYFGRLIDEIH
jgi:DNA-binding transcriptional LysR family regulator